MYITMRGLLPEAKPGFWPVTGPGASYRADLS